MNLSQLASSVREHGLRVAMARAWQRLSQTCEMSVLKILRRQVVRTRYGVRMRANWTDATFRFCYFGSYGRALADLLDSYDQPFVLLDIGANQGLYSLIASRNPNCRVALAFEPVPSTFDLLSTNVRLNADAYAKTRCIEAGIASECRSQDIFVDPGHSGLASLEPGHGRQAVAQTIELITHREVDELLRQHASEVPNLVVKIDVEGYEEIVATELVKLSCAAHLQAVFYEVDERWTNQSALRSLFADRGFTSFATFGAGDHYDVLATREPNGNAAAHVSP